MVVNVAVLEDFLSTFLPFSLSLSVGLLDILSFTGNCCLAALTSQK